MSSDDQQRVDSTNYYVCAGCGDMDSHNLVFDEGAHVCTRCGTVTAEGALKPDAPSVVSQRPTVTIRRGARKTYLRKAHIVERMSLALCQEPRIPRERKKIIYEQWQKSGLAAPATKTAVRRLLRLVDKSGVDASFNYCQKYLEKWKSIRRMIYKRVNIPIPPLPKLDVIADIGTAFDHMSRLWTIWQMPLKPRSEWKFPERKHFPSFNLTIVRLHELYGHPYDPDDWPLPSPACCAKVNVYIDAMFRHLGFIE